MIYTKFKRERFGKCNICLNPFKLTYDHVPPRGSTEIKAVEQENIFNRLTQKERRFNISQNGVKFRTLCSVCNNDKLGAKLDPILNDFSRSITLYLKSNLILPNYIEIETKPIVLIRAIIGHLLAAKINIDYSENENMMREIVFNYNETIPKEINIFYWIFPYENTIIMRDFAMPAVRNKFQDIGIFSVLKFFPVAYLLTNLNEYEGLPSLTSYSNFKFDERTKITINLKNVKKQDWPENIDRGNFLIGGADLNSSVFATPRKKG
jgi:hypothetical protein